jgi:hypothetical protein
MSDGPVSLRDVDRKLSDYSDAEGIKLLEQSVAMLCNMVDEDSSVSGHDTAEERPRGMLTEADRRYLRGEEQFDNENTENSKRHRIRQRIRNGILDFSDVRRGLDRGDARMVYDTDDRDALDDAMIDALAFLYLGSDGFEKMIEEGIERAVEEYTEFSMPGIRVRIHIDDKDAVPLEEIIDMIKSGEELPPVQAAATVQFTPPLEPEQRRTLEAADHPTADTLLDIDRDYRTVYGDEDSAKEWD